MLSSLLITNADAAFYAQDFSRPPTPTDWQRFLRYACRVRHLHHAPAPPRLQPAPNLFNTLAYTRLSMHILPNLQTLYWLPAQDKNEITFFLHPRLRTITMALPTWAMSPSVLQPCSALPI